MALSAALTGQAARAPGAVQPEPETPRPAVTRVVDGAGRSVGVPRPSRRIVSLAPSVTEILFALGAGGRVVGVTRFCTHPPEAVPLPRIGGLINPDLERIVDLKPDLAVATTAGNYLDDAERIERLGIPVYTIDIPTLAKMLSTLETIGALLEIPEEGRRLAGKLRGRIDRVRAGASGRAPMRALFVIEPDPLIAPGPGTFIGEALEAAGAPLVTPPGAGNWAQLDMEQVIGLRPDLILTAEANRAWAESLPGRPEWAGLPAVRAGRVVVVSDAIQHPGPRLVEGIEEVAAVVRRVGEAGGGMQAPAPPEAP